MKCFPVCFSLVLIVGLAESPTLSAQISSRDYKVALRDMNAAAGDADISHYLAALDSVLEKQDSSSVRAALSAYSKLFERLEREREQHDIYLVHRRAAKALSAVKKSSAFRELDKKRRKDKSWATRLLLLDAAVFHEKLDIRACCLEALEDKHPAVMRRALDYLVKDRKESTVEAIIQRYVEIDGKTYKKDASQWNRTLFHFRSTLRSMLNVDLPAAVDWKNYFTVNRGTKNLFKGQESHKSDRTALTLFGTEVTGKNIVFVLDVSGSMRSTDPAPPEVAGGPRRSGRTGIGGDSPADAQQRIEERRRITRAKKELNRVIQALASDIRFNVIAYSSDVSSWSDELVKVSKKSKTGAKSFVSKLKAKGITVTDMALAEAFADLDTDTVYLLTDGAPTHIGTTGPGLPEDARELMATIHEEIKIANYLRNIRIFTLGFQGAEIEFLKKLSAENGGSFVEIK